MATRSRKIFTGNFPGGTITWIPYNSQADGYKGIAKFSQDMTDTIGDGRKDHPLRIVTAKAISCVPLSGQALNSSGVPTVSCSGYIPSGFAHATQGSYLSPSNGASFHVPKVLSRANPSRPYVDAGVFLGELRDFPAMGRAIWQTANRLYREMPRHLSTRERLDAAFKRSAKEVITNADEHFIANQFGWLPFVSDIYKFIDVGGIVEMRAKELQALQQRGSNSRTTRLETLQSNSMSDITVESLFMFVKGPLKRSFRTEVWGSARFSLDVDSPLKTASADQIKALAQRSVMGLTVDQSTAWNLMPWSWLIDWASNIGDWVDSTRNIVGAHPKGSVCIMTKKSIAAEVRTRIPANWPMSGGVISYLQMDRRRDVFSPGTLPEVSFQILSGRQSAILSSLMTLRAKRSYGS